MDYKSIINLMKEMNNTDLTKLEIEEEGLCICMEKLPMPVNIPSGQNIPYAPGVNSPMPIYASAPAALPAGGYGNTVIAREAAAIPPETAGEKEEENHKKQVSPMVGTFYAQPSPDKPPFVKVGDMVKKGQTLCIIEAMKLLNEIESEYDGEIVSVLADNEEMVEFGQTLFLIK
ncbi:acetyl-CoA carboxylase biotin carboxyl carrier protein [Anaerotaenia torta]|uniref:acetyl-CoA carboxylase biotin carboxyl carrier protein n=1 Tax=Anaerotaenia torta TaxID=433293 RepID=UPI003D1C0A57